MSRSLRLPVLAAACLLAAVAARADDAAPPASTPEASPALVEEAVRMLWQGEHDACWGDRYEKDEDLKTGNEMTEEEILRFLNAKEPGV